MPFKIEINDLSSVGCVRDVEASQLPPEAWSFAENMRFSELGVERMNGREQVFGTPGVAPHFAMPIATSTQTYWLYVSLLKAFVYDGTTHTNITRTAGGDYAANATKDWNGTVFGGVPILNNGVDVPQYWSTLSPATPLAALANWPATARTRVIRAFGPYLVAMDITKSGTRFPHMFKWSHPADPGTIPSSWDETDPTKDAGESDLPDVSAGTILDGLPLQGNFYVYKEGSIWRVSHIGGSFIFDFKVLLQTAGILAPRCVALTGDGTRHVVATQDDILVHNGQSVDSILDKRYKRFYVNNVDVANYTNSFMFTNPFRDEVWFCFPEVGQTNPTRALIWNYKEGQRGAISEAPIAFRNATGGTVETADADTWATTTETWETTIGPWSQSNRQSVVACAPEVTKFLELDKGSLDNGATMLGTLQRTALSFIGRKRTGEWIVDYAVRKLIRRVWIKASGGPINVRVGFQEIVDGPITWGSAVVFNPETALWVDAVGSGKAVAVEFSAAVPFRIIGYKIEGEVVGQY